MILTMFVAAAMVGALLLFALAGGADFGGGIWALFARGEEAERELELVNRAIGPIWEANELWIVVAIVILWCGFPSAFAALGITLFVPLMLVLMGILLRGAFFAFQEQRVSLSVQAAFGRIFGAVSVIAPFFFGVAAGTVASGRLRLQSDLSGPGFDTFGAALGYLRPWLGPFPLAVGLLAVVTCAYLSATYLTLEATDSEDLRESFRRRGLVSGTVLALLGVAVLPVSVFDAPYLWSGLTSLPSVGFMAFVAVSLAVSLYLLHRRSFWWARTFAIIEVFGVFCAWAWAQYPYLVVDGINIYDAASPTNVQIALLILSFFYAAVLGPSLYLLFRIFKGGSTFGRSGN